MKKKHAILAVDDDEATLEDLADTIKSLMCVPLTAASEEQALEVLKSKRPCMVLLDLQLRANHLTPPKTSTGFNLLRHIRHQFPQGKLIIVLISAHVKSADTVTFAFRDEGIDDYVGKPFKDGELEGRIRHWLERCPVHAPKTPAKDGAVPPGKADLVFDGSPDGGSRFRLMVFGEPVWVREKSVVVLWRLYVERAKGKGGWMKPQSIEPKSYNVYMTLSRTRKDLGNISSRVVQKRRGQLRIAIPPERVAVNNEVMREHFEYLDTPASSPDAGKTNTA